MCVSGLQDYITMLYGYLETLFRNLMVVIIKSTKVPKDDSQYDMFKKIFIGLGEFVEDNIDIYNTDYLKES